MSVTSKPGDPSTARTPQEKVAASRSDDRMFVLSGQVSPLYVTDGAVNLLQGMRNKMAATGMGAAVQGMSGGVANAAMVAMYDGESAKYFGCYLGERMVIGTFESIGFKEGDEIKAVVTQLDEKVAFAHAVVRISDGLLWMPSSISKGRWKIARWFLIACLKNPQIANLSPFSVARLRRGSSYQVYDLRAAFKAYGSLNRPMTPETSRCPRQGGAVRSLHTNRDTQIEQYRQAT